MSLNEGQLVTYALDEIQETYSVLSTFSDNADHYEPDAGSLQRSSNQYWMPLDQKGVVYDGWDTTGQAKEPLSLSIAGSLSDPSNARTELRADNVRDERSYRRQIRADMLSLLADMEQKGLETAALYGSFCIADSQTYGPGASQTPVWDAIAAAEERMFSTGMYTDMGTCAYLNGTTYRAGGKALVEGSANFSNSVPNDAYRNGKIQDQIGGFSEVYRHNKLVRMTAQSEAITVNGNVSLKPEAYSTVGTTKINTDNRYGTITVTGTAANINVGDKFKIAGVKAVTLDSSKVVLDYDQTFTVVGVSGQDVTISPRPVAYDDAALSDLEKAYANINTQIANGDTLVWLNTTARQSNVVLAKDAMCIASSPIPYNHELFKNLNCREFKIGPINGLIGFDASLDTLVGGYRMAIWYDWQIKRPEAVGIILDAQV